MHCFKLERILVILCFLEVKVRFETGTLEIFLNKLEKMFTSIRKNKHDKNKKKAAVSAISLVQ